VAKAKRKLSAKQIRAGFGGKRRKAAAKHRPRTKKRANPKRRRSNPPRVHHRKRKAAAASRPRARKRKSSHRPRTKRRNPELVSFLLGNPATKRRKKVAAHRKRRKKSAASHRSNAGRPRRKKTMNRSRRHRNPSVIGTPKRWLEWGAGGVVGFVGSAALPQLLAPNSNTGMTGYALSLGATIGLGLLSHMFLKRPDVTVGVMVGGLSNLLRRVITDNTPYGSYLNSPTSAGGMGMGDYMVANWGPPRMTDGLHSSMAEAPGTPWSGGGMVATSYGVNTQDLADMRSSRPC
jgi:hypothetical protein